MKEIGKSQRFILIRVVNNNEFDNNRDFRLSTSYSYKPNLGKQYAQLYAENRSASLFYEVPPGAVVIVLILFLTCLGSIWRRKLSGITRKLGRI